MTADVPRETALAGSAPPQAGQAFGPARLPLAERYAELLATEGVRRGLLGPREAPRLWDRHLLNCAALAALVAPGARVCDVGSGAGLPGIALAIARPGLRVSLVEPLLRRTTFLDEVVAELDLTSVEVIRARAEDLHGRRTFDAVVSRAVAPLGRLAGWSMPLVAPAGELLAMKGTTAREELAAAASVLRRLGCSDAEVVELPVPGSATPTWVVRARRRRGAAPGG